MMTDSSSTSDEEEKAKLQSATWQIFPSSSTNPKVSDVQRDTPNPSQVRESLRHFGDGGADEAHGDYRSVDATPEMKRFIAKKLTSYLDSSLSEVSAESTLVSASWRNEDDVVSDFRLFSTSKPGCSLDDPPQPIRKQPHPPSSSDSDSDEERQKLASVAISYDQIFQNSLNSHPAAQDPQVITNPSPTNNLTPGEMGPAKPLPVETASNGVNGKIVKQQKQSDCRQTHEQSSNAKTAAPKQLDRCSDETDDLSRKLKKKKKKTR